MATPVLQPTIGGSNQPFEIDVRSQRLLEILEPQIKFHQKWRRINMFAFLTLTLASIGGATLGSVLGAMHYSGYGAAASAMAAFCIAAEKTLLLREKWKLHVETKTALESLKAGVLCSSSGFQDKFIKRFEDISRDYAQELPVYDTRPSDISEPRTG